MKLLNVFPTKMLGHSLDLSGKGKYLVPITFFAFLVATIFVTEVGIMGLLFVLPEMPNIYTVFLDGFLLTAISFPLLFFFYLRPMLLQVKHQQQSATRAIALLEILNSLQEVSEDFQLFLDTAVQKTAELLGDGCIIHLLSENERQLIPTAYHHVQDDAQQALAEIMLDGPSPVQGGIEGQVVQSKALVFLPSVNAEQMHNCFSPACHSFFERFGLKSLMIFPLQMQGRLVGTLFLFRTHTTKPYTAEDVDFVQTVALKAALAIHNARLYQAEQRSRQTAETLGAAAITLTQTLKLEYIFNKLLDYLELLVPFDTACLSLLEDEMKLAVRAVRGRNIWTAPGQTFDFTLPDGLNLLVEMPLLTQRTLLIPDAEKFPGWENASPIEAIRSWLSVPIVTDNNVMGLCLLGNKAAESFTPEHIQWTEAMLRQAAVAIQNAWLFEQVRAGRERLQSLSHRLVEVQENERRYIARELHDEAGQALTSLMVGLRLIERDAHHPEAVLAGAAALKKMVNDVLENLHRLAVHLRPASLDHLGLISALQQYIEDFSNRHNLLVQFETFQLDTRLRDELETVLYRIVQEALTNVIKHAQATRVDVLLERRGEKLITIVEDNGIGFDAAAPLSGDHLGLFGIRERLEILGGMLQLESTPGSGTTLFVEVPYETQDFDRR